LRGIILCRVLLVLGVLVGIPSLWETLSFSWDPAFQAPALRYGPRHSNYHAFREFTLTLGAILVMLWAMFQPPARRERLGDPRPASVTFCLTAWCPGRPPSCSAAIWMRLARRSG